MEYNKTLIGGFDNEGESKIVAIDESLFIHDINGDETWILGGIETKEKKIRFAITKVRNMPTLENFVYENFKKKRVLLIMDVLGIISSIIT